MEKMAKDRLPNVRKVGQTKNKQVLSFYHDCMLRVFDNHASRQSEYLENVFLTAARTGDSQKLCSTLERVDLNKVDFDIKEKDTECTPLMVAAECGHEKVVSILLSCGSDVTLRNAAGQTVIDVAPEKIKQLILDAVNRQGAGQSLLWQAAWQGNATIVKKLLNLNPNLNTNSKNSEGLTPLLLVTRDLALFDQSVLPSPKFSNQPCIEYPEDYTQRWTPEDLSTLLHERSTIQQEVFSEDYNPAEVVAQLLHQNADCTAVDNEGRSALHLTARHHGTNARNIISLLGRKDSLDIDMRDHEDRSALHFASEIGDPVVMLALIDSGANVNARGHLGRTPLHITASRGDERSSGLLVEHGANVLLLDDLGFTPMDVAKGNDVRLLLKEAWTEQSQRSLDSQRINSAPNVSSMVKLEHLEIQDVSNNYEEDQQLPKKAPKKSPKNLRDRSHSEEQNNSSQCSELLKRVRSHSSGSTPRWSPDPVQDISQSQPKRVSLVPPKSSPGYSKDLPRDFNLRQNKSLSRQGLAEVIPRTVAKVAVLNIDLRGSMFSKHKSKSCGELPFTRRRVGKLSSPHATPGILEKPLDHALSLRGRSMSAASFSTMDILPRITQNVPDERGNSKQDDGHGCVPWTDKQTTKPTPSENSDQIVDERDPAVVDSHFLNRTFNSKEKKVFWFPLVSDNMKQSDGEKIPDRAFFVDLNNLENPLPNCTKCGAGITSGESKPSHGTLCFSCDQKSTEKSSFWVSLDDERCEKGAKMEALLRGFDDRTVLIDKKNLCEEQQELRNDHQTLRDGSDLPDRAEKLSQGWSTFCQEFDGTKVGIEANSCKLNTEDVGSEVEVKDIVGLGSSAKSLVYNLTNNASERSNKLDAKNNGTSDRILVLRKVFCSLEKEEQQECQEQQEQRGFQEQQEQRGCEEQEEQEEQKELHGYQQQQEQQGYERQAKQLEQQNIIYPAICSKPGSHREQRSDPYENEYGARLVKCGVLREKPSYSCSRSSVPGCSAVAGRYFSNIGNYGGNQICKENESKTRTTGNFLQEVQADSDISSKEKQRVGNVKSNNITCETEPFTENSSRTESRLNKGMEEGLERTEVIAVVNSQGAEKITMTEKNTLNSDYMCGNLSIDSAGNFEHFGRNLLGNPKNVESDTKNVVVKNASMLNYKPRERNDSGYGDYEGMTRDGEDQMGAKAKENELRNDTWVRRNSEVTPNEVVIVNPFPTPEPPKVPVVNVTSNCQCDRFSTFEKNVGTGVRRKVKGKTKKSDTTNQKSIVKSKKGLCKGERDKKSEAKQLKKTTSRQTSRKKKGKVIESDNLKEISVIQTNLKGDLLDKESAESHGDKSAENIPGSGSEVNSLPVRNAALVKGTLAVLSPIPESPRPSSIVLESAQAGTTLKTDVTGKDESSSSERFVVPRLSEIASVELRRTTCATPEKYEAASVDEEYSIRNCKGGVGKIEIQPVLGLCENNSEDVLSSDDSEFFGTVSEVDEELEDMIQEILEETEELEKDSEKLHANVSGSAEMNTNADRNTNADNSSVRSSIRSIIGARCIVNSGIHITREALSVNSRRQSIATSPQEQVSDSTDPISKANCSANSVTLTTVSTSVNKRVCCSANSETHSNVTTSTDVQTKVSTFNSSNAEADVSSDYSTLGDDTWDETSVCGDHVTHETPESNHYASPLRPSVVQLSEPSSASSVTIFMSRKSSVSSSSRAPVGDDCESEQSLYVQFPSGGGLVHSRLSRCKSESSGTPNSEMASSEEEEIVWKKGNMLGKGAFGTVWCGLTNTGQMIAVKQVELITSNLKVAERQYEKLQEEVALLKSLRHENIVSYLGTCLDGGVVNIFMQFVPGGSIASILTRFGPLEEPVFRYYTKQIVVGVDYLHRNNVVHRDIKGGNIMLMPTGIIKLIDFGCAKRLYMNMSRSQGDLLRSMRGTPYWMAPEVITETGYGRKSDIWSIGCTVFEMATGRPPWSHLPPMSAIFTIGQGSHPPRLSQPNSKDACDFVARSMTRDPDARWSAEELLRHPFIKNCNEQR